MKKCAANIPNLNSIPILKIARKDTFYMGKERKAVQTFSIGKKKR